MIQQVRMLLMIQEFINDQNRQLREMVGLYKQHVEQTTTRLNILHQTLSLGKYDQETGTSVKGTSNNGLPF